MSKNILLLKFYIFTLIPLRISPDVNYTAEYYGNFDMKILFSDEENPMKSFSEKQGFYAGLTRDPYETLSEDSFDDEIHDGYLVIFHDPFEFPSKYSPHFYTTSSKIFKFVVEPELISTDESMLDVPPEE